MAIAGGYDGSINIDSRVDTAGFNKGIKNMSGGLGNIMGVVAKLGAVIGGAFAVAKMIAFGKEALTAGANLERLRQAAGQVGATFGITVSEVGRITDEIIKMGIQDDIAYESFINMARNGLDTALLPALARGAQDLNAFSDTGVSSSEVLDRLMNGVITLQTETLRTAGVIVNIDQATRKWAQANDVAYESITAEQKQAATLIAVIEKLKGVEGLYELSQRTAAGQMSSNTRIMNQLMMALGGPFQNALYIVIRTFNQFVGALTGAIKPGGQLYGMMVNLAAVATWVAQAFRTALQAIAGLFGLTIPDLQGVATTADAGADALGSLGDAAGDAAGQTEAAGKAAKGALAPFDELNVLQQKEGAGGGGTPPGGVPGGGGIPYTPVDSGLLDAINAKLDELKAKFAGMGTAFQPVIDAFKNLVKASKPLVKTLWGGLQWLWEKILVPFGKWVISEVVPRFLNILGGAATFLNDILVALQPAATWLWEKFLQPLAKWTGGMITQKLQEISTKFGELHQWATDNPKAFETIVTIIGIFAVALGVAALAMGGFSLAMSIGAAAAGVFTAVMTFLTSPVVLVVLAIAALIAIIYVLIKYWPQISEAAQKAFGDIGNFANQAVEWVKKVWAPIGEWFKKAIDFVRHLFHGSGLFDDIETWAQNAWDTVKRIWSVVTAWFHDNVTKPVSDFFSTAWTNIKTWAENAWNGIVIAWTNAATWFNTTIVKPIHDFFGILWSGSADGSGTGGVKGFFTTAWANIKTAWENAGTWFNTTIVVPIHDFFGKLWTGSADGTGTGGVKGFFTTAWADIQTAWKTAGTWFDTTVVKPIHNLFGILWTGSADGTGTAGIKGFFTTAWNDVKTAWKDAGTWFDTNVVAPIKKAFCRMLFGSDDDTGSGGLKGFFSTAFSGVADIVRGAFNGVITALNNVLSGIATGINALLVIYNTLGAKVGLPYIAPVTAPVIPYIATGAVIPPNAQFLAVLGDQRNGRNLEAPESLIRQIVREESGSAGGEIKISFEGTMGALIRELQPRIRRENVRIGRSMVTE